MADNAVALAALGVLATCVGAMVWVVKKVVGDVAPALDRHTRAADKQATNAKELGQAVRKNTQSNDQLLTFMKNLNGKLAHATIQTVKEQNVAHQHIEHVD